MKKKWILHHCDLGPWPKVTVFNRVPASAVSSHLAKTASKSIHPFGWNFVHKKPSDTLTDTQTNWSENITPPWFRRGVKIPFIFQNATESGVLGSVYIQTWNATITIGWLLNAPHWIIPWVCGRYSIQYMTHCLIFGGHLTLICDRDR